MARKTIPVEQVKQAANRMLADSIPEQKDGRIGVFTLLERILFDTDNYHGYRYLRLTDDIHDISNIAGEIDDTRRQYY